MRTGRLQFYNANGLRFTGEFRYPANADDALRLEFAKYYAKQECPGITEYKFLTIEI